MGKIYTIEDMIAFAESKGGKCHSKEYIDAKTKLKFECSNNHIFKQTWNKIKSSGRWCSICLEAERREKKSIKKVKELKAFAKNKGGQCHIDNYINVHTKVLWECNESHKWESSWANINFNNSWCPHCAGQTPHTLEEMQNLAISRGGKCLSEQYTNNHTHYEWECQFGHIWKGRFSNILRGTWCGICNKSGINEELLRVAFETIFKTKFHKVKPLWLKSPNDTRMELDGFSKELSLGFEYQGIQHFEKNQYITTNYQLDKRIMFDEHKVKLCKQNNVCLVVIDYKVNFRDFAKEIKKKCIELGFPISKYDFNCDIDWNIAYLDSRYDELKELLESKDGQLLSKEWIGANSNYLVKCNLHKHTWDTSATSLFAGHWCKICARDKQTQQQRLGIDVLKDFAHKFKGKCLSKEYLRRNTKYNWECSKGHKFTRSFNTMLEKNRFCATCDGTGKYNNQI